MNCPNCNHKLCDTEIVSAAASINAKKPRKDGGKASRENGKKGGRPRKHNDMVSGGAHKH